MSELDYGEQLLHRKSMKNDARHVAVITNYGEGTNNGFARLIERIGSANVTLIVPADEGSIAMRARGLEVEDWRLDRSASWLAMEVPLAAFHLARLLKKRRVRVAHSLGHLSNVCTFLACLLTRTPAVILSITGLGSVFLGRTSVLRVALRLFYRVAAWAGAQVACENAADEAYLSYIQPSSLKRVIHAGVDLTFFAPASSHAAERQLVRSLGLDGCTVVTFIGRLIIHKGIRELLQAWTEVERSHPNARLLVIGEADPGNHVDADALNGPVPDSVLFLGRRDDVRDLLSISDIVVNPSHREGMSRVNMEALASAKAVVTTNAPGCAEMVDDGVNGILVPIANANALAAAIDRLISDPSLRESMGRASRRKAEEFSIDSAAEKLRLLYCQCGTPTSPPAARPGQCS